MRSRIAITAHDGEESGDRAVHADQRCQQRDEEQHQDEQARAAVAGPRDQLLPGPRGHARRVEGFADDEERGDEDHGRVAEAGQRLLELEDTGRPEGERHAEGHGRDRQVVPDEDGDRRPPRTRNVIVSSLIRATYPCRSEAIRPR